MFGKYRRGVVAYTCISSVLNTLVLQELVINLSLHSRSTKIIIIGTSEAKSPGYEVDLDSPTTKKVVRYQKLRVV